MLGAHALRGPSQGRLRITRRGRNLGGLEIPGRAARDLEALVVVQSSETTMIVGRNWSNEDHGS